MSVHKAVNLVGCLDSAKVMSTTGMEIRAQEPRAAEREVRD